MHTRTGAVQEHDVHSLRIMGLVAAISSFFGYGRCACRPVQRHAVRDNQDYTMDTLDLRAGKLPGSIESRARRPRFFCLPRQAALATKYRSVRTRVRISREHRSRISWDRRMRKCLVSASSSRFRFSSATRRSSDDTLYVTFYVRSFGYRIRIRYSK